jgi:hypothetical protein
MWKMACVGGLSMIKFIPLVVLLTSFLVPTATRPQETDGPQKIFPDELLDHMVGDWHLSGSALGEAADHHVVEWVLNHQFLRIHEKPLPRPKNFVRSAVNLAGGSELA